MGTVKEFKDAGLVFVEGDKAEDKTGYSLTAMDVAQDIGDIDCYSDDIVKEFAWRTNNTGEKPSYKGLVEITYNGEGCEMKEVRNADSINWLNVNEWRPVISKKVRIEGKPQVEGGVYINGELIGISKGFSFSHDEHSEKVDIKPIYTKEMHEAGEFKNGDKVQVPSQGDAVLTFIGASAKYKTCILEFDDGSTAYELVEFIRHADTRTDEEKLIDAMIEDVDAANPNHKLGVALNSLASQLIAMGYRKP